MAESSSPNCTIESPTESRTQGTPKTPSGTGTCSNLHTDTTRTLDGEVTLAVTDNCSAPLRGNWRSDFAVHVWDAVNGAFSGTRKAEPVERISERLQAEAEDASKATMALLIFSSMHESDEVCKNLESSERMLGYAGVADLDISKPPKGKQFAAFASEGRFDCSHIAVWWLSASLTDPVSPRAGERVWGNEEFKIGLEKRIWGGLSMHKLVCDCELFRNLVMGAKMLLEKLQARGIEAHCWFTGGKSLAWAVTPPLMH